MSSIKTAIRIYYSDVLRKIEVGDFQLSLLPANQPQQEQGAIVVSFGAELAKITLLKTNDPVDDSFLRGVVRSMAAELAELRLEQKLVRQDNQQSILFSAPIGMIVAWSGEKSSIPKPNWRACNGKELKTSDYPELAKLLGKKDKEKFHVPDLRGYFIRGYDPKGDVDKDRKRKERGHGSVQKDSIRSHSHKLSFKQKVTYADGGGFLDVLDSNTSGKDRRKSTDEEGKGETRPVNVAFWYIIRVK